MKKCGIVGAGKHAKANLIPALQRLQEEGLIEITCLCRKHVEKGDEGLGVPVVSDFPTENVDFLVVCGHPNLHQKAIAFSREHGIPVFVEKPHYVQYDPETEMDTTTMIGYNFNFTPSPKEFQNIFCTSCGIYEDWPDLFPDKDIQTLCHVFHGILVHPIAVLLQGYGQPQNVYMVEKDVRKMEIVFEYEEGVQRRIFFSSQGEAFSLNLDSFPLKPFKAESYYHMLKYYVQSHFQPKINNLELGQSVLAVIDKCLHSSRYSDPSSNST